MDSEVEQGLIGLQAQADAVTALQNKILHDLQAAADCASSQASLSTSHDRSLCTVMAAACSIASIAVQQRGTWNRWERLYLSLANELNVISACYTCA